MVLTSYFANLGNIKSQKKYSIARYTPKDVRMLGYSALFPDAKLLKSFETNKISRTDFIDKYKAMPSKQDIAKIKHETAGSTLFCYEKPDSFCHRRILRKWFAENGVLSLEWKSSYKIAVIECFDNNNNSNYRESFDKIVHSIIHSFQPDQSLSFIVDLDKSQLTSQISNMPNLIYNIPKELCYGKDTNHSVWRDVDFGIIFKNKEDDAYKKAINDVLKYNGIAIIHDINQGKITIENHEKLQGYSAAKPPDEEIPPQKILFGSSNA